MKRGAIVHTSGLCFLLCERRKNFEVKRKEVFLYTDTVSIQCAKICLEHETRRWNLSAWEKGNV